MARYRFRLTGVPPDESIKSIDIDATSFISEVKETLYKTYKINPMLGLHLFYKGKVLPNHLRFERVGIHPQRDVITLTTFEIIPDFKSLETIEFPLDSIKELIQEAGIENINEAGIQALGKILVKIGIEISVMDKLREPFHWKMVEDRIQNIGDILKRKYFSPLASVSHLINKSLFLAFAIMVFVIGKDLNFAFFVDDLPILGIIIPLIMLCGLILFYIGIIR